MIDRVGPRRYEPHHGGGQRSAGSREVLLSRLDLVPSRAAFPTPPSGRRLVSETGLRFRTVGWVALILLG